MSSFRIRPRFSRTVYYTPDRVEEMFREGLEKPTAPCIGKISKRYITLHIPEEEQHYWSPQLSMSIEEHDEGTEIHGTYGPHPNIWSAFFYGYAAIAIVSLFVGIWGCSLWMLKKDPWVLWGLPVLGGIALVMYIVAQGGQKFGAEQTFTLHHFFEETVGEKAHIH